MSYFVYIDDEEEIGELVGELFFPYRDLEYMYFCEINKALSFIEENDVRAVLCDQNMPDGLGSDIANEIPESIIFAIATGNNNNIKENNKINRILNKPFFEEEFTQYLEYILKES